MLDFGVLQNRHSVVGDEDISITDQHLVKATRAKRAANCVCEGRSGGDIVSQRHPTLRTLGVGEQSLMFMLSHATRRPEHPT